MDVHKALDILVLYAEGCPATPKTIDLIEECISDMGLRVDLMKITIHSQDESDAWKFLGSPTVQVNGPVYSGSGKNLAIRYGWTDSVPLSGASGPKGPNDLILIVVDLDQIGVG